LHYERVEKQWQQQRKQQTDAGETLFNSNKKRDQVWTSRQYYTKLQNKINEGDTIPRHKINQRFDNLSDEKKTIQTGAERMKGMLVNIDELIRTTLVQTNGTVSSQTIATMIAGGVNRVQPVSANSIAKYVMSTIGAKYTSTKLQPTINERQRFN
jgi:hypothetical protein